MKSNIIISICSMHKPADNMFSGMLLHQIKSSVPVNLSSHFTVRFDCFFCIMNDLTILLMYFQHFYIIQRTKIAWLSASFRIKSCLIQNDLVSFFTFSAFQNFCSKFFCIYIFIIQFSCLTHCCHALLSCILKDYLCLSFLHFSIPQLHFPEQKNENTKNNFYDQKLFSPNEKRQASVTHRLPSFVLFLFKNKGVFINADLCFSFCCKADIVRFLRSKQHHRCCLASVIDENLYAESVHKDS